MEDILRKEEILREVLKEAQRSVEKFGEQKHHQSIWHTILSEEVGEAAKEVNDFILGNPEIEATEKLRAELIQVAAVAVNAIYSLEKHTIKGKNK